jgi:hypothetical protein
MEVFDCQGSIKIIKDQTGAKLKIFGEKPIQTLVLHQELDRHDGW